MTCLEAQSLITLFINDELEIKKLENFLEHINKCSECKEELEVYYALLTGMKQLDEDQNLSSDFHGDLIKKLRASEDKIIQKKIKRFRKRMLLLSAICVFAIFSGIGVREYVEELFHIREEPEKSDFLLDYYYFKDKDTRIKDAIEENYDTMIIYKNIYEKRKNQLDTTKKSVQPNIIENQ